MVIKIEFELKDKEKILIFGIDEAGTRKEIGHIFTPAGSGNGNVNAIQVCGFDHAYDFWGCGVYGDKATGKMKKDIQLLWFGNYDMMDSEEMRRVKVGEKIHPITEKQKEELKLNPKLKTNEYVEEIMKDRFSIAEEDGVCGRCFNHPCTCEVNIIYGNPYLVKREQDVRPSSPKDYEQAVKNKVLNALEGKSGS